MRIFLTGVAGNVGAAVLTELLRRGHEVTGLVHVHLPDAKGYRPVVGPLSRARDFVAEIAAAGAIIHCASPRSEDRATVMSEDIEGTAQLLDAWSGGPFVFMSSQTVYGVPARDLVEEAALHAGSWYDIGKICNEQQVELAADRDGRGPGINLRLPLVFAGGVRRRDRQYLPLLFDALRAGHAFLFGDEAAMQTAGSVFIGEADVARAVADSLEIARSGPYNLAGGFCTWRALIEALGRHAGLTPRFTVRAGAQPRDGEFRLPQSRSFYDCGKFEAACRFRARESLDEIVGRFVAAERTISS